MEIFHNLGPLQEVKTPVYSVKVKLNLVFASRSQKKTNLSQYQLYFE